MNWRQIEITSWPAFGGSTVPLFEIQFICFLFLSYFSLFIYLLVVLVMIPSLHLLMYRYTIFWEYNNNVLHFLTWIVILNSKYCIYMQQIDMALTNIRGSDSLIFRGSQILYLFIFSFSLFCTSWTNFKGITYVALKILENTIFITIKYQMAVIIIMTHTIYNIHCYSHTYLSPSTSYWKTEIVQ